MTVYGRHDFVPRTSAANIDLLMQELVAASPIVNLTRGIGVFFNSLGNTSSGGLRRQSSSRESRAVHEQRDEAEMMEIPPSAAMEAAWVGMAGPAAEFWSFDLHDEQAHPDIPPLQLVGQQASRKGQNNVRQPFSLLPGFAC